MSLPRFFAPTLTPSDRRAVLPAGESRHLTRVLRLGVGDAVQVFDGRGGEWRARVDRVARDAAELAIDEPVVPAAEPPVQVTLAIGLLKGAQMDGVVRDATMLGVRRIQPMVSAHVTVPVAAVDSGQGRERWRRIAVSSTKQCGRAVVPDILPARSFAEVLADRGDEALLMCVEPAVDAGHTPAWHVQRPDVALVLVGPEGGWAESEVTAAIDRGAGLLSLGPRTLRAEAVPAVLLSAVWTRWGW